MVLAVFDGKIGFRMLYVCFDVRDALYFSLSPVGFFDYI